MTPRNLAAACLLPDALIDLTLPVRSSARGRKEQTPLSIMRLRYGDAPSFVDVSSVINAYTIQGQASANGEFNSNRKTLDVTPDRNGEVTVVFGLLPRGPNEIALLTRSMAEILLEVSAGIEVPPEHVAQGRTATATRLAGAENPRDRPLIRIRSSASPPADSYAAVQYRNTWYWIDDGDLTSKRVFTFLMIFFSLAETGVTPQVPVLTIPAS